MEFHSSFDFTRRNVVTARFETLRQRPGSPDSPVLVGWGAGLRVGRTRAPSRHRHPRGIRDAASQEAGASAPAQAAPYRWALAPEVRAFFMEFTVGNDRGLSRGVILPAGPRSFASCARACVRVREQAPGRAAQSEGVTSESFNGGPAALPFPQKILAQLLPGAPGVFDLVWRKPQPQAYPLTFQDNRQIQPQGAPRFGAFPNRGSSPLRANICKPSTNPVSAPKTHRSQLPRTMGHPIRGVILFGSRYRSSLAAMMAHESKTPGHPASVNLFRRACSSYP
jgi:hypothetical protein